MIPLTQEIENKPLGGETRRVVGGSRGKQDITSLAACFSQRRWKDPRGKSYVQHGVVRPAWCRTSSMAAVVHNRAVQMLKYVVRTELMFTVLTLTERKITTNHIGKRARSVWYDGRLVSRLGWWHLMYISKCIKRHKLKVSSFVYQL